MLRRKPIDFAVVHHGQPQLAKKLTAFDLIVIGVAGTIGAGIFVLTGTAAATKAGPAVILSFMLAGLGCGLAGLCYSELAACLPAAGSAYSYAYVSLGEFAAWFVGWALVNEYAVGALTVAIGWSGYLAKLLKGFGIVLPHNLTHGALDGGVINLPAVLLVLTITAVLIVGVKESARAAGILVLIKLVVIGLFVVLGAKHVRSENWNPFMPFGWYGVVMGAGAIFYAYLGFDAVSTVSEEAKNPQRDLVIGTLGSLGICTLIYITVALVLTGVVKYPELNHPAPVALALERVGIHWGYLLVTLGAVVGLGSVIVVLMMSLPRIFMAMSRDGLIPAFIARVHPRFRTPHLSILVTSALISTGAGILPISVASEMTSIGTLCAFVAVCGCVISLRKIHPELERGFKVPFAPWVPLAGIIVCCVIMTGLSRVAWYTFSVWTALGLLLYAFYGRKNSALGHHHARTEQDAKLAELA